MGLFDNPAQPLAEGGATNNGPPGDDLDFDLRLAPLVLGLLPATVVKVKKHTDGRKLIVEFKINHSAHPNTVVSQWCDPNDRGEVTKMKQTINALGIECIEQADGRITPACGWLALAGLQAIVALDEYKSKLCIPRFGKIMHADCPKENQGIDYGCGVMPIGGE